MATAPKADEPSSVCETTGDSFVLLIDRDSTLGVNAHRSVTGGGMITARMPSNSTTVPEWVYVHLLPRLGCTSTQLDLICVTRQTPEQCEPGASAEGDSAPKEEQPAAPPLGEPVATAVALPAACPEQSEKSRAEQRCDRGAKRVRKAGESAARSAAEAH